MARLKRLAARDVMRELRRFGFEVVSIRGSHVKLARVNSSGRTEVLVVPMKRQPGAGTVHAIYRQSCRFIPQEDVRPVFFAD